MLVLTHGRVRTKHGPGVHGPPLWTGSMDHFHGPGPWTTCHGPGPWTVFFNDTATTEIYTLSLHDALPISVRLAILDLGLKERVMLHVQCACFDSWHD